MKSKQILGKEAQAKGQNFEIRIHNKIKRSGALISARSSGSKGFADIISINKNGTLLLTLCKTNGYLEPKERRQINEMLLLLPKVLKPKMELRYYKSKKKMGKIIIDNNWENKYNKLNVYGGKTYG